MAVRRGAGAKKGRGGSARDSPAGALSLLSSRAASSDWSGAGSPSRQGEPADQPARSWLKRGASSSASIGAASAARGACLFN
jgi:hypothetical protein